jgi:serine/threonine protein kinase
MGLEGYTILEELPRGGQAVVYKALHKATKAKVALKVLLPGLSASSKARRYFKQEVELAASLSHPNIVAIRDSGIARGQYYFSMEYVHGQPLDRYVVAGALSFRDKIILFNKICDAMTHAHQRGVIHRDLKPSNILVDERGEPHVLDFGLAKTAGGLNTIADSTIMPSITGQIKGTLAYMSPEQAAGRSDLVDVRTDVYTLGVILYQILTGEFPYDVSGSAVETLQNIQLAEPQRPRKRISRFDSDIEAILLKCLEKDAARRYQSAAELRDDIQRWLGGLPIMAKSVSSIYLLRKIVARHRYTASVVGLLMAIILAFSYVGWYLRQDAISARNDAEAIADQWFDESVRHLRTSRQLAFLEFLNSWRKGDEKHAAWVAKIIASGTAERQAAEVLLRRDVAEEKLTALRDNLPSESTWYADLVLAEDLVRRDKIASALEAYERCHRSMTSPGSTVGLQSLLRTHVEAQLYQLSVRNPAVTDLRGGE